MKKRLFFFLLSAPLFLIFFGILFIAFSRWDFSLYPRKIPLGRIVAYTDTGEGGHSELTNYADTGQEIRFDYTLRKGYAFPYMGLVFEFDPYFDLRPYDHIEVSIGTKVSRTLRIYVRSTISNYTDPSKALTALYHIREIPVWQKKKAYDFEIRKLEVPGWWYELNHFSENDPIASDFSRVMTLEIANEASFPTNVSDSVHLDKIRFYRDKKPFYAVLTAIAAAYIALILLISWLVRIYRKRTILIIPYRELQDSPDDSPEKKLIHYLGGNFSDPELSVEKAGSACAVPMLKIPAILKQYYGMTFPQYLNSIRMEEAKRLLRESSRQITDIALAVGYSSAAHFNRQFKKVSGMSPVQYRKIFQEKKKVSD